MTIPAEVKPTDAAKLAQLGQLVRDNQFITAVIVFVLWQAGALAHAAAFVGGVC